MKGKNNSPKATGTERAIAKYVEAKVLDAMTHISGEDESIAAKEFIAKTKEVLAREENIHIDLVDLKAERKENSIVLLPQNLYTAIVLNGFRPDPRELENKTEYKTPMGTFRMGDDNIPYFIPIKPIEYIELGMTIAAE